MFLILLNKSPVAFGSADDMDIRAKSFVLIDSTSGRVLAERAATERRAMASTTKIMTAIIALENGNLDSTVKASSKAASISGSSFRLKNGDETTLNNMLYGLLIPSGNDAAMAIAEHIAGGEEEFVNLMNLKAVELGAINTHYQNPHGLDAPEHYSTAKDLATIALYAWGNPKFREIVGKSHHSIEDGEFVRQIYSTNRLLANFDGANGIKTGYTAKAGKCLVGSAIRNGIHLISVVMGADDHFNDSNQLLNYGFSRFGLFNILEKEKRLSSVPIRGGVEETLGLSCPHDVVLPIKKGEDIGLVFLIPRHISAPISKGDVVGEVEIYLDDVRTTRAPLEAMMDVRRKTYIDYYLDILGYWLAS